MKKLLTSLFFVALAFQLLAQGTITGTVVDDVNDVVIGAAVSVKGTTIGTITDIDGKFTIKGIAAGEQTVVVSYLGYATQEIPVTVTNGTVDMGAVAMTEDAIGLSEVVVTGVVDLVKDRETPIAVSTIKAKDIQLKLGNQEFPEIMKTTPSVYATKQGGGYGDSRINVRGFDQRNVAIIINGQPVNDMENGWVYWSNWAGLQDIASGVEIQRGVGASKLAVPSVGGTINIVTKSTDREAGGFVNVGTGNDGYVKTTASYSTGTGASGWSASFLMGRWQGNGYADGTKGEGYNYLAALGYAPNEMHKFNLTFTGAAQWHHQRSMNLSIRDYQNYGGDDFRRFNGDWGEKNGEEYSFRRNFYNKPIATLNYDLKINNNVSVATAVYGSWGRGGGTGPRGRNFGIYPFRKDLTEAMADGNLPYRTAGGLIDFDGIVANNEAGDKYTGDIYGDVLGDSTRVIGSNGYSDDGVNSNIAIRRSSINSHNWYGIISNLTWKADKLTFGLGIDGRTYKGLHYRVANDFLGLDGYYSTGNDYTGGVIVTTTSKASPLSDIASSGKINYYNIGLVNWGGVNGMVEYSDGQITGVVQGGLSTQQYKRIDYFAQFPTDSDRHSMLGGFIKGGVNYNINKEHNVFANVGYISKQPIFDAIFPNFANNINEDAVNESILSFELGYGFRSRFLNANLNLYRTSWDDRFISQGIRVGDVDGTATFEGLNQIHQGVELDFTARPPVKGLRINGMLSVNDWVYNGDVSASVFDDDQQLIDEATLFVDGIKVGDAAQMTAYLGVDYQVIDGLSVDLGWNYVNNLYSDFSFRLDEREWANDTWLLNRDNEGALKLPSYNLFDAGLTYNYNLPNNQLLTFRLNVNNIFDTEYISEASSSIRPGDAAPASDATVGTFKGIDNRNFVWFGFGRTWNVSAKYSF